MEDHTEGTTVVQSVERALSILEMLAREGRGLALTELSQQLNLSPSTTHRLLASLMNRDYVFQDPSTKKYWLGMKVLELSWGFQIVASLQAKGRRFVRDLARIVGETVNMMVLDRSKAVIVDRIESQHMLKFSVPIGTRLPLHCTAAGKALLAHMPTEAVEDIIQRGLVALTPNTITDRYQLLKELEHIRAQGYSIDNEEREPGVRCVAAPIWASSGRVVAIVSISGPSRRITSQRLPELGERVKETALSISFALGYDSASEKSR